jgi:cytoskeleton protein RodZ
VFEIGNSLREARIRKGLDLKEAEEATKIRSKYLQALEDDDFEVIPGPAFVKGFLRTYATFLGLDADLLLDEYRSRYEPNQELHPVARRPVADTRRGPRRQSNLVVVGAVALVLLLVLAWWARGDDETSATLDPVAVETSSTTTLATVPALDAGEEGEGATNGGTEEGSAEGEPAGSEGAAEEGDGTAGDAVTTTTLEGRLVVEVTAARGRCWLLIKEGSANGRILYSGTLEAGDSVRLDQTDTYWANVGAPSTLDLTLNGEASEVPEPYGNFLITAAGPERIR